MLGLVVLSLRRGLLLGILAIVDGIVAAIHVGLSLGVRIVLRLTVPGRVSSKRRLVLCLHRHRGRRLRGPRRLLLLLLHDIPALLH